MDQRFYQRIPQNYGFFFKKIEIFETQNFTKISAFIVSFLFFLPFFTSFSSISPIQSCQKIMEFLVVFLLEGLEILSTNSENF